MNIIRKLHQPTPLLMAGLFLCIPALPAVAQTSSDQSNENKIEEVIVTAQKREQKIQDVTVAVSAIGGQELIDRDVTRFEQIDRIAPSIVINGVGANGSISIRGIGTSVFSTSSEPAVLTVIDDLAVLQAGQAFTGFSDIQRIEVLRGPQGTLFGKGASAGVVNIVTRGPSDTLEAGFNIQAIFNGQYHFEGAVSGPITDRLSYRLSGYYNNNDGFVRNLNTGNDLGDAEEWGFRAKLRFEATDNFLVDLNWSHTDVESNLAPVTYRYVPPGATVVGIPVSSFIDGIVPGPRNREVIQTYDGFQSTDIDTISARAVLDIGSASILSITGYQDWYLDYFTDFDGTTALVFDFPPFNAQDGVNQGGPYHSKLFSQEFRLVSDGSSPLNYLLGLYYANGSTTRYFLRSLDTPLASNWDSDAGTITTAVFGELTYMFDSRTEVTAGFRYNHEKIDVTFQNFVPPRFGPPPANNATCLDVCTGENPDDVVTYKFAVRQELNDEISVYGSFATGYKGAAYDISSGFNPKRADNPAQPENSDAYELGLRSLLFDGTAQLNITGFLTNYDQFQSQAVVVPEDPRDAPAFQLTNVGKLRTKGIEVEYKIYPIENLQLSGFLTYTNAKIVQYPFANCYQGQTEEEGCIDPDGDGPLPASQDLYGAPLNNVPKWRFNLFGRYDIELNSAPFDMFVQGDWSLQSSQTTSLAQDPVGELPGFGLLNLNVGFNLKNKPLMFTFFVSNVLDKYYNAGMGRAIFHDNINTLTNVVQRNQERQFGVRLTGNF